eukprot:TRINITY_DN3872_c1_g1_i2.p1 TRINITY_DN3872_c1_g1~~TRINITY_DN3872_c1_g1_i2.p1  ORF type:complete len:543 (-),score=169.82 TRINITY_DN3872_c1_g1_i2:72-1700(-)
MQQHQQPPLSTTTTTTTTTGDPHIPAFIPTLIQKWEVCVLVQGFLREERFKQTSEAFAKEAEQYLNRIPPNTKKLKGLSNILNEFLIIKQEKVHRERVMQSFSGSNTIQSTFQHMYMLVEDYYATRKQHESEVLIPSTEPGFGLNSMTSTEESTSQLAHKDKRKTTQPKKIPQTNQKKTTEENNNVRIFPTYTLDGVENVTYPANTSNTNTTRPIPSTRSISNTNTRSTPTPVPNTAPRTTTTTTSTPTTPIPRTVDPETPILLVDEENADDNNVVETTENHEPIEGAEFDLDLEALGMEGVKLLLQSSSLQERLANHINFQLQQHTPQPQPITNENSISPPITTTTTTTTTLPHENVNTQLPTQIDTTNTLASLTNIEVDPLLESMVSNITNDPDFQSFLDTLTKAVVDTAELTEQPPTDTTTTATTTSTTPSLSEKDSIENNTNTPQPNQNTHNHNSIEFILSPKSPEDQQQTATQTKPPPQANTPSKTQANTNKRKGDGSENQQQPEEKKKKSDGSDDNSKDLPENLDVEEFLTSIYSS